MYETTFEREKRSSIDLERVLKFLATFKFKNSRSLMSRFKFCWDRIYNKLVIQTELSLSAVFHIGEE